MVYISEVHHYMVERHCRNHMQRQCYDQFMCCILKQWTHLAAIYISSCLNKLTMRLASCFYISIWEDNIESQLFDKLHRLLPTVLITLLFFPLLNSLIYSFSSLWISKAQQGTSTTNYLKVQILEAVVTGPDCSMCRSKIVESRDYRTY